MSVWKHLFARADSEMAAYREQCARCGQCCRFASYDHRLFVTTMELAYLLAKVGPGTMMYCAAGKSHGIKNTGKTPLLFYFYKWQA